MESSLQFPLQMSAAQAESLTALQRLFAEACNFLAPIVRDSRCWNRVALHHLTYKSLRERFPQLGSQMACNAIYSVCRSARLVYQHPDSRWNVQKQPAAALPLLRFLPAAPVFFDRHTLSLKDGRLSLFTLDGRMHFGLDLAPEVLARFRAERLREIALMRQGEAYVLHFRFGTPAPEDSGADELPEYLIVLPETSGASGSSGPDPAGPESSAHALAA